MNAISNMEKFPVDGVGLPPERQNPRVKREDQGVATNKQRGRFQSVVMIACWNAKLECAYE